MRAGTTRKLVVIGMLGYALLVAAPASATFPGKNGMIAYTGNYDSTQGGPATGIFAVNPDGSGQRQLIPGTLSVTVPAAPAWSSDGQRLAYDVVKFGFRQFSAGIFLADADGQNARQLTTHNDVAPTFSPNGRRIAFVRAGRIFSIRLDGSDPGALTPRSYGSDYAPAYSPSGKQIAYARPVSPPGGHQHTLVCVMRKDGTHRRCLTSAGPVGVTPDWSPNGKWIAFVSKNGVEVIRPDGSGRRLLVTLSSNATLIGNAPTYSPDGRFIAFINLTPDGRSEFIQVARSNNGSKPHAVTSPGAGAAGPAWQPLPAATEG